MYKCVQVLKRRMSLSITSFELVLAPEQSGTKWLHSNAALLRMGRLLHLGTACSQYDAITTLPIPAQRTDSRMQKAHVQYAAAVCQSSTLSLFALTSVSLGEGVNG